MITPMITQQRVLTTQDNLSVCVVWASNSPRVRMTIFDTYDGGRRVANTYTRQTITSLRDFLTDILQDWVPDHTMDAPVRDL